MIKSDVNKIELSIIGITSNMKEEFIMFYYFLV